MQCLALRLDCQAEQPKENRKLLRVLLTAGVSLQSVGQVFHPYLAAGDCKSSVQSTL